MKTITVETTDNGYKAEAIQTMIHKFEKAAAFLFPGCTVRHFYYGETLDMADVVLGPGRYAHFNITAKRVSLCGYECNSADLEQFGGMTHNDECFEGNLLDLVAKADGTKRQMITPEQGKIYKNNKCSCWDHKFRNQRTRGRRGYIRRLGRSAIPYQSASAYSSNAICEYSKF